VARRGGGEGRTAAARGVSRWSGRPDCGARGMDDGMWARREAEAGRDTRWRQGAAPGALAAEPVREEGNG
jgi:hypothetical protein